MKTFKKVFVAIDDSQPSQHAIDYAALLARREDATITFCHSVSLASRFERRTSVDVPRNLERLAALRQHARELLAGAQATASGRAVIACGLELVGSTAAATVNAASRRGASAIVVGTQAAKRRGAKLDSALADDVLRLSDQPVILVSRPYTPALSAASIVVALDGSAASKSALDFALDLAADGRKQVIALHVLSKHITDDSVRDRKALLADVVTYGARRGVAIEAAFARGHLVEELAHAVKILRADLLVVGSDGPSALRALPIPSVARRVANEIGVPVAVVRSATPLRHALPQRVELARAS